MLSKRNGFKRFTGLGAFAGLAALALIGGAMLVNAQPGDRNQVPPSAKSNAKFSPGAFRDEASPRAPIIGSAVVPGALTSTSISLRVTNSSAASTIGARDIRAVILDCHQALKKDSLTIDSVFGVVAPPGGTATVTTGNDADDVGPAVLTYTSFNNGELSSFAMDPDTWENASFGATVKDMIGCRVEVVFSTGILRGDGILKNVAGTVQAAIIQRNPS